MRPKIYLLGDSITQMSFRNGGWGSSLQNYFSRKADVTLRGYGGYNTRWFLQFKEKIFPPPSESDDAPLAVTVFFGANDAAIPDRDAAFQHVPIDEYKQNLLDIAAFLKGKWPSTHTILITPPPIDEEARLLHPYVDHPCGLPDRTNEAAGRYAKKCLEAAAECGLPAIDLWKIMQQGIDWKRTYLSNDGLHPTPYGDKVIFEEVIKQLSEKQISPETLKTDLPLTTIIDPMIHSNLLRTSPNERGGPFGFCSQFTMKMQ